MYIQVSINNYKIDDPAPRFYLAPKVGKTSLTTTLNSSEILTNLAVAFIAKVISISQYRLLNELKTTTKE